MAQPTYQDVINLYTAAAANATMERALAQHGMQSLLRFATQDIMRQVAQEVPQLSAKAVVVFAESFNATIRRNRDQRLIRMYNEIGTEAVKATAASYKSSQKNAALSGYRSGDRYSGGVMLRAVSSPKMFRAGRDGLTFGNTGWLNSQAKQWARLNFGAGPRGTRTRSSPPIRMTLFGTTYPTNFALNRPARPAFWTPQRGRGFWVGPGGSAVSWSDARRGKDKFFPLNATMAEELSRKKGDGSTLISGPSLSMGFVGSRFMDAGVKTVVELFPIGIAKVLNEWLGQARQGKGGKYTATLAPSRTVIKELERKTLAEMKRYGDEARSQAERARRMALIARF